MLTGFKKDVPLELIIKHISMQVATYLSTPSLPPALTAMLQFLGSAHKFCKSGSV